MVSKTRKKEKSRKSGSLFPEGDQFELDEITQVIGRNESRHSSGDERDVSRDDLIATSTTMSQICLKKLSRQVDTKIQEGLSQSLSRLEDRLKSAIENLHITIVC